MRLLGLSLLLFAVSCSVAGTEYSESGFYVGASIVRTWDDFGDVDSGDFEIDSDTTTGFGLRGGIRVLDHFAVELAYEDIGKFNLGDASADLSTLMAQAKFYPLTGRLQPYAVAGMGFIDGNVRSELAGFIDGEEKEFVLRAGAGLEVFLIPFVSVFGEFAYSWPQSDLRDFDYYTAQVGAALHF